MAEAEPGSRVRVRKGELVLEGLVMPRHAFSQPGITVIKLDNGYNVGIEAERIEVLERPAKPSKATPAGVVGRGPPVAVLGTGGTIASYVEYRTGAVRPATTPAELAAVVPEIGDHATLRTRVLFQVFSEDMAPPVWDRLADEILKEFEAGARGVVVTHGTDTMHVTAAALSFVLRDLPGPVVLVGAQRSSDRPSSDAAGNLVAAARTAASADVGEVVVCMHEHLSDDRWALHRGTRCRKMHTSRRDAFQSLGAEPVGHVDAGGVHLAAHARPAAVGPPRRVGRFEPDVGMIWTHPGIKPGAVAAAAGKGLLLAGTGLGHVPAPVVPALKDLVDRGVLVAMTSQCLNGRVGMAVYERGRELLEAGVVPLEDMLPETGFAKLSWALGTARSGEEARRLLLEDVAGETGPRTPHGFFGPASGGDQP